MKSPVVFLEGHYRADMRRPGKDRAISADQALAATFCPEVALAFAALLMTDPAAPAHA
ncbi:MAG TPA: hypothetical protein VN113_02175 [Caulobacter sp.]|nr:hypothetical protein [Caulobacter sp.]